MTPQMIGEPARAEWLATRRRAPQFRSSPYYQAALEELDRLALAGGYQPFDLALPEPLGATLGNKQAITVTVSLLTESYIWAFASFSQQAEGFDIQITDLGTRSDFFSAPTRWDNVTPQGSTNGITHPLFILPRPRLVLEPGLLSVQLTNRSTSSNLVQLVIFTVEPVPCRPVA